MNAAADPLARLVVRCQTVMSHAWMVRTFVKHSPEVEDFPELMGIVRSVFDTSRALETRVDDPPAYLSMLRKKLGKLRAAADEFRADAPQASTHTNFAQAVISIDACVAELSELLAAGQSLLPARNSPVSRPSAVDTTESEPDSSDSGEEQTALPQNASP